MKYAHFFLAAGCLVLNANVFALEATSNSGGNQVENMTIDMKLEYVKKALQSVINQMLTCNNAGKIFTANTSASGRDANGCIDVGGVDQNLRNCASQGLLWNGTYCAPARSQKTYVFSQPYCGGAGAYIEINRTGAPGAYSYWGRYRFSADYATEPMQTLNTFNSSTTIWWHSGRDTEIAYLNPTGNSVHLQVTDCGMRIVTDLWLGDNEFLTPQ